MKTPNELEQEREAKVTAQNEFETEQFRARAERARLMKDVSVCLRWLLYPVAGTAIIVLGKLSHALYMWQ